MDAKVRALLHDLIADNEDLFPAPPSFSDDRLQHCREMDDFRPILFEWYKFVGSLNTIIAHIKRDSPAFRPIPRRDYHILVGLLNRCARLILANIALSHQGLFGETTAIIDRCIFESSVKTCWLCSDPSDENFTRYLADGLKTELEFRTMIEHNIEMRNGKILPLETTILKWIDSNIRKSELDPCVIASSKKMPDLASIIDKLAPGRRLLYIVGQKIGSHHVHGTWSSLVLHYLEQQDDGEPLSFAPRSYDCDTHIDQFAFVPKIVLAAMTAYANYVLEQPEAEAFVGLFETTEQEINKIYNVATGNDV